jgi:hypothetical protein
MRNDVVLVDGPNPNFFRQTGIVQNIAEAIAADTRLAQKLAKSNNGCRDASSFDGRAVVLLPALFTRSCCFHQKLSTTSSATRATKSLQ